MTTQVESSEVRSIKDIAHDIRKNWEKVNYGAKPYLEAMMQCDKIGDMYYADRVSDVVRYFLSNATTWRGEDARRIKAELKGMLETYDAQ